MMNVDYLIAQWLANPTLMVSLARQRNIADELNSVSCECRYDSS